MNFASVCTGIGAPEMAWKDLPGWACQWMAEIEPFPSKVLNHYYPDVPNLGDMTKLNEHEHYNQSTIDLLVGGTPCQSFSIAGLRGGMADQRGNLSLEYCRILLAKQPKWFLWENVPGVFSSFSDAAASTDNFHSDLEPGDEYTRDITETSDFATLLTAFRECGYSVSYRVFDSKHFGVPQRRRRVFVVGHLGNDWRPSAAVLFERDSLRRDFTPGKEKRKRAAGTAEAGIRSYGINSTAIGRKPGNGGNGLGISNEVAPTLTKADKHGVASFGCDLSQMVQKIKIHENESVTIIKGGTAPGHKSHVLTHGMWWDGTQIAHTLTKNSANSRMPDYQNFQAVITPPFIIATGQAAAANTPCEDFCPTLTKNHEAPILFQPVNINPVLCIPINTMTVMGRPSDNGRMGLGIGEHNDPQNTISKNHPHAVFVSRNLNAYPSAPLVADTITKGANQTTGFIGECIATSPFQVRRLTPLECGRLQGFPDGYGNIPGASDTALYAAFGNSMTVHVMRWLGERIDRVDKLLKSLP